MWLDPASLHSVRRLIELSSSADVTEPENLSAIASLFNDIQLKKMKFPPKSHSIGFIPLIENQACTLSIFYIPKGSCLPYHDHPRQHVFLRTLAGDLELHACDVAHAATTTTTTFEYGSKYPIIRSVKSVVNPDSGVSFVTPDENNIHQITALTDAMFLDLIIPPYSYDRSITYFTRDGDTLTAVRERDVKLVMDFCDVRNLIDTS